MNHRQFMDIARGFDIRCNNVLEIKEKDYGKDGDRLIQFYNSAVLEGIPPTQAVWDMMKKHVTSLMERSKYPTSYSFDQWFETLGDISNYCRLMWGVLSEMEGMGERPPAIVKMLEEAKNESKD